MKYSYITDLDIDTCRKRFCKLIQNEASNGVDGKIGSSNNRFMIKKVSSKFSNSFQRSFFGEFSNYNDKTIITGKFKMSKSIKILMVYFNLFFLFIEVIMFLDLIRNIKSSDSLMIKYDVKILFIPIIMLGLIYFMYHIFPKLNNREERYIEKILVEKLKAKKWDK